MKEHGKAEEDMTGQRKKRKAKDNLKTVIRTA